HAANQKRENSANNGKRNSRINQESLFDGTEGGKQQDEDQQQSERHHNHQPCRSSLKVFKLSTVGQVETRRFLNLFSDSLLRLFDKTADITTTDIHFNNHASTRL